MILARLPEPAADAASRNCPGSRKMPGVLIARASSKEDPGTHTKIIGEGLDFIWNGMKA